MSIDVKPISIKWDELNQRYISFKKYLGLFYNACKKLNENENIADADEFTLAHERLFQVVFDLIIAILEIQVDALFPPNEEINEDGSNKKIRSEGYYLETVEREDLIGSEVTSELIRMMDIRDQMVHNPDMVNRDLFHQKCEILRNMGLQFWNALRYQGYCPTCSDVNTYESNPEMGGIDYCATCRTPYVVAAIDPLRLVSLIKVEDDYYPAEEEFNGAFNLSNVDEIVKQKKLDYDDPDEDLHT